MAPRALAPLLPLLALLLGGCDGPAAGVLGVVNVASVVLLKRTVPDIAVSAVTGRDCSMVRLDRGETYCRPEEGPPAPPPYCTRSLGAVDCWTAPPAATPDRRGLADGPTTLTAAQERERTRRWWDVF